MHKQYEITPAIGFRVVQSAPLPVMCNIIVIVPSYNRFNNRNNGPVPEIKWPAPRTRTRSHE